MCGMKIISVAAPCNGSGKTSLMVSLLKTFPRVFSAVKFTTIYREEQFCPVKDHDCACHRLQGQYIICADSAVLSQPDTDTGKIWSAGATQTLWGVARLEGYPDLIRDLQAHYWKDGTPVLMEGNTVAQYIKPQLSLFVVNPTLPNSWWKDTSQTFLKQADFVIVNAYPSETHPADREGVASVKGSLREVEGKSVNMEPPERLDQWQDQRLYKAVSDLLSN